MRPFAATRPGHLRRIAAAVALAVLAAWAGSPARAADAPPALLSAIPADGATGVSPSAPLALTFSEPVDLPLEAVRLDCARSGRASWVRGGGPLAFDLQPQPPLLPGDDCQWTVLGEWVTDLDSDDPPNSMTADATGRFTTAVSPAEMLRLNEVDAIVSPGDHEFIELFDGGAGDTPLDGLALALFDATGSAYASFDLDGRRSNRHGYFVVGSSPEADIRIGNGELRDGPAGVALFAADAVGFPIGQPVSTEGLVDAVVYGHEPAPGPILLALLLAGQAPLDEATAANASEHSLSRCPNGSGERRVSVTFRTTTPTAAGANACAVDPPPSAAAVFPAPGATAVAVDTTPVITFTESVTLETGALIIGCSSSGRHEYPMTPPGLVHAIELVKPLDAGETCQLTLNATAVLDSDTADPPDAMLADYKWSFETKPAVATSLLINELDADTPGRDTLEFIELFDGGKGDTTLDGLVLVLLNGTDDTVYRTIALDGQRTDAVGYLTVGNKAVPGVDVIIPDAALQNGPDGAAVYEGTPADYPVGSPLKLLNLIDAMVYGPSASADSGLLTLLLAGERQVDEGARGSADTDSSQRCPSGSGGQRKSAAFRQRLPTPGAPNTCPLDSAPSVAAVQPADGAEDVDLQANLVITFTEPIKTSGKWAALTCERSGAHALTATGGSTVFELSTSTAFLPGEICAGTITGARVTDLDSDDPYDAMLSDYTWRFSTAPPPPSGIVINELDSDTPGSDTAEFIELYGGGAGNIDLTGLILILFNGSDDRSYRAIDLKGLKTDTRGYLTVGNATVPGVDVVLPDGFLQNGVDAVALYARAASAFPNGTPLTTDGLIDAIVYGEAEMPDDGLLALLAAGQPAVAESSRGSGATHSLQRCPNGAGLPRHTDMIVANLPTPDSSSACTLDEPPRITSITPTDGAEHVDLSSPVEVEFSEPVVAIGEWLSLSCDDSGSHATAVTWNGSRATITSVSPFTAGETCRLLIHAAAVSDADQDDPPDTLIADVTSHFKTTELAPALILINEIDADTPGSDTAEFVELFDGGVGNSSLDGLTLVFFNGTDDRSYFAIDLDGLKTNTFGYAVVGNPGLPGVQRTFANGKLQNGPDAVALYAATADRFPSGTGVTTTALVDAVVYGNPLAPDLGLAPLLEGGQLPANEDGRDSRATDSLQRCPNGTGGPRRTASTLPYVPTPGEANLCISDVAPAVAAVRPVGGAQDVELLSTLTITFTEPVSPTGTWLTLSCEGSGGRPLTITGGPIVFEVAPDPLEADARCDATVFASAIHDLDDADPPDAMAVDFRWSFTTAPSSCGDPRTPIAAVQGGGSASPLAGRPVTVEGTVTGFLTDGSGFYLSALETDIDTDAGTSEGLAVAGEFSPSLAPGNHVRVRGVVGEPDDRTTLLGAVLEASCGPGEPHSPATLTFPISPMAWEAVESMPVVVAAPLVVASADDLVSQGYVLAGLARPLHATETLLPGPAAAAQLAGDLAGLVRLDYAWLTLPASPRAGTTMTSAAGIADQNSDGYRLLLYTAPALNDTNPRPETPNRPPGRLLLASMDLDAGQLQSFPPPRRDKVIAQLSLLNADILALTGLPHSASVVADLVDALNLTLPQGYAYLTAPPGSPVVLYRAGLIRPDGAPEQLGTSGEPAPFAVAQVFTEMGTGERFRLAVASLPGRTNCPDDNSADTDQGDGQGCSAATRLARSGMLANWLAASQTRMGEVDLLLVGSLWALRGEPARQTLVAAGLTDVMALRAPDAATDRLKAGASGPTVFRGVAHPLLATPGAAAQVSGVSIWAINADEPPGVADGPGPARAATSDPLLVGLNLGQPTPAFTVDEPILVGRPATFTNRTTWPTPLTYTWDFGDGSPPVPVPAATVSHRFARPGVYTVTLVAADAAGQAWAAARPVVVRGRALFLPVARR